MEGHCVNCEEKKEVKLYTTRDAVTDQYTGSAEVCDGCVEAYEELNNETLCLE